MLDHSDKLSGYRAIQVGGTLRALSDPEGLTEAENWRQHCSITSHSITLRLRGRTADPSTAFFKAVLKRTKLSQE